MPYRIALTSTDGRHIDQHLNAARSFWVLQINEEKDEVKTEPIRMVPVSCTDGSKGCAGHASGCSSRNFEALAEVLAGCTYLLTQRIGKLPYAVLQAHGITALEVDRDVPSAVQALRIYYRRLHLQKRAGVHAG